MKANIDEVFSNHIEELCSELDGVEFICCTADMWSTQHKSYIGVTAHWVDKNTLQRKSTLLARRRFNSPHGNTRIAEILNEIYDEFKITFKLIGTVTDNAANFVLAFRKWGVSIADFNILNSAVKIDEFNDDMFTKIIIKKNSPQLVI